MPVCMIAAVTASLAESRNRRGEPGSEPASAAAVATALMLAVTLVGNRALNASTVQYLDDDAADWRALHSRWRRLHLVRVVLDLGAFAALSRATLAKSC